MDEYDKEALIGFSKIIGVGVILGIVLLWGITGIGIGVPYNTVGTVELYEQSGLFGEHTWVVLKTLGGVEAEFTLTGYHDFEIGKTYEIHTIRVRGSWMGTWNWYEVQSIIER